MTISRIALAASIGLPPPIPITPSHPSVAITIETGQDVVFGRVGLDVAEDDRCRPSEPTTCATSPLAIRPGSVTTSGRVIPSRASSPASRLLAPAAKQNAIGKCERRDRGARMLVERPRFGRNGSPRRSR